jgi:hypothetical protein
MLDAEVGKSGIWRGSVIKGVNGSRIVTGADTGSRHGKLQALGREELKQQLAALSSAHLTEKKAG